MHSDPPDGDCTEAIDDLRLVLVALLTTLRNDA